MAQLQELGFEAAELEPMDPVLVRQFVVPSHAAVKDGLTDEAAAGNGWLLARQSSLPRSSMAGSCRDLADTPLLAGPDLRAQTSISRRNSPSAAARSLRPR